MKGRIFVAINPPAKIKEEAEILINKLSSKEKKVNWINPKNLHLTLAFLGQAEEEQIAKIVSLARFITKSQRSFTLGFGGVDFFPSDSLRKIIWLRGNDNLELFSLQKNLIYQLRINGFDVEDKMFIPHFTIGRSEKGLADTKKIEEISKNFSLGQFFVNHFDIMKSTNSRQGLQYERLFRIPLSYKREGAGSYSL